MNSIIKIIQSTNGLHPHVNPTVIYNEGWMTRLLVFHSVSEKIQLEGIDFAVISNWTSEALISSPFIHAQENREGYTHADMAIGDFEVDFSSRGEIRINADAKLFGIIEAKMGSNLSQGTKHASEYNQASRNLVCIAENTKNPDGCKTFFYIVAPESTIKEHEIKKQIELNYILNQIEKRFNVHLAEPGIFSKFQLIVSKIKCIEIKAISYEMWISLFTNSNVKTSLQQFYNDAKKWNRIK